MQGSHTSSTTIFLGSTTLGEIREIEGQQHREQRFKSNGMKVKKRLYHAVVDANNDSSEFHRFCDTELLKSIIVKNASGHSGERSLSVFHVAGLRV